MRTSLAQATQICNAVNKRINSNEALTMCKNTLLWTLQLYTQVFTRKCYGKNRKQKRSINVSLSFVQWYFMIKEMFELGELLDLRWNNLAEHMEQRHGSLNLDGVVFMDQSHIKTIPVSGIWHCLYWFTVETRWNYPTCKWYNMHKPWST